MARTERGRFSEKGRGKIQAEDPCPNRRGNVGSPRIVAYEKIAFFENRRKIGYTGFPD